MSSSRAVYVAAAVAIAAIVGYVAWTAHDKRAQKQAIASLVGHGSAVLAKSLEAAPGPGEVASAQRIAGEFSGTSVTRQPQLARTADEYLAGARVIAQRRFETQQLLGKAAAAREALAEHVAGKARRDEGWIRRATELRRAADQQHADLERGLNALAQVLEETARAGAALAPQLGAAPLVPEAQLAAAARQAREDAMRANAELDQARRLPLR